MTEYIYLNTLHHTGTWFLISFLYNHPDVCGFSQLVNLLHHLIDVPIEPHQVDAETLIPETLCEGINIIHSHFRLSVSEPKRIVPSQKTLIDHGLVKVVPVRDPLLSHLSAAERNSPSWWNELDEWVLYLEYLKDLDIIYLPVDLLQQKSFEEKRVALTQVLKAFKLRVDYHARTWAMKWPIMNTVTFNKESKRHYYEGNVDWIKRFLPNIFTGLQEREEVLRPILESIGYKDLIWYS